MEFPGYKRDGHLRATKVFESRGEDVLPKYIERSLFYVHNPRVGELTYERAPGRAVDRRKKDLRFAGRPTASHRYTCCRNTSRRGASCGSIWQDGEGGQE